MHRCTAAFALAAGRLEGNALQLRARTDLILDEASKLADGQKLNQQLQASDNK